MIGKDILKGLIEASGTVFAALIVGVAGGLIGRRYSRERDRQDKESQWRQHAIELAKLDLERKLKSSVSLSNKTIRPSVLDFLANYRDLQELDHLTPKELYERIRKDRVASRQSGQAKPKTDETSPK